MSQAGDGIKQNFRFGLGSKAAAQAVENKAESAFGIGRADGMVVFALLGKKSIKWPLCANSQYSPHISRIKG